MKANPKAAALIAPAPLVRTAFDRARTAARDTAARLPRNSGPLDKSHLAGVRPTALLVDGGQAKAARRAGRLLRLPRTIDDTGAWAALGALAALVRVVDDGRHRSVVVDAAGPRSVFTRWASRAGFAPLSLNVMRPDVVGSDLDPGTVDMVVRLHPHSATPDTIDLDLAHGSAALRHGGVISLTARLGPADEGSFSVADLRGVIARADEQGLGLIGDVGLVEGQLARRAADAGASYGLALLTFRRR